MACLSKLVDSYISPPAASARIDSSKAILDGHGEYVVYSTGKITKEVYEKAYAIFCRYSPAEIARTQPHANRYSLIRREIINLDPELEIAFLPRALMELLFIHEAIQEELDCKTSCMLSKTTAQLTLRPDCYSSHTAADIQEVKDEYVRKRKSGKCWHLGFFKDEGDNQDPDVKDLAFRLNQIIVDRLSPKNGCFSYGQIKKTLEEEFTFFEKHYQRGKSSDEIQIFLGGPTTLFANAGGFDMAIETKAKKSIIRDAIQLECSVRNAHILYRGSKPSSDNIVEWWSGTYHSLSFGTGLFAGAFYDPGATAWLYMNARSYKGLAYVIPYEENNKYDLFYVPNANYICQLKGWGEAWHARTKAWNTYDFNSEDKIPGIARHLTLDQCDNLRSASNKDTLVAVFNKFKSRAIPLRWESPFS